MHKLTGKTITEEEYKLLPQEEKKKFVKKVKPIKNQIVKGYSRNSKCPCGSGKRFKRCCMKLVQDKMKEKVNASNTG